MSFSLQVKNEMISEPLSRRCCKRAALSAFLRTAGTIVIEKGKIGFTTSSEGRINEYFAGIVKELYGEKGTTVPDVHDRTKFTLISDVSLKILEDAHIVSVERGGLEVQLFIGEKFIKKDCCLTAFVVGAFLGAGSITIPKVNPEKATSYHLEFVFSKHATARDFAEILGKKEFITKLIERKDSFVVYFKNCEEICDLLVLMGASNSSLELTDVILQKNIKNNTNRVFNCEMSNLSKQIDASLKVRMQIETIERLMGLEKLPLPLKEVAVARMDNPEDTLSQLAEKLSITKSCLSHRLKKLCEIADSL